MLNSAGPVLNGLAPNGATSLIARPGRESKMRAGGRGWNSPPPQSPHGGVAAWTFGEAVGRMMIAPAKAMAAANRAVCRLDFIL